MGIENVLGKGAAILFVLLMFSIHYKDEVQVTLKSNNKDIWGLVAIPLFLTVSTGMLLWFLVLANEFNIVYDWVPDKSSYILELYPVIVLAFFMLSLALPITCGRIYGAVLRLNKNRNETNRDTQ
ncbi:hypothetical protein [Hydromonas duriensis]|uniref:Uncharacterized protein n=1 Tax=Hydromonas duriensis TaxID=1527608 RepID=A0A4R6Y4T8_9BURK|nr:hypothetical protein [Hydromonas duriensis]TDR28954.1 hypothetical protein DFR44_13023 [Hydromonas duriensis]